jgi:hypothetical protein
MIFFFETESFFLKCTPSALADAFGHFSKKPSNFQHIAISPTRPNCTYCVHVFFTQVLKLNLISNRRRGNCDFTNTLETYLQPPIPATPPNTILAPRLPRNLTSVHSPRRLARLALLLRRYPTCSSPHLCAVATPRHGSSSRYFSEPPSLLPPCPRGGVDPS